MGSSSSSLCIIPALVHGLDCYMCQGLSHLLSKISLFPATKYILRNQRYSFPKNSYMPFNCLRISVFLWIYQWYHYIGWFWQSLFQYSFKLQISQTLSQYCDSRKYLWSTHSLIMEYQGWYLATDLERCWSCPEPKPSPPNAENEKSGNFSQTWGRGVNPTPTFVVTQNNPWITLKFPYIHQKT